MCDQAQPHTILVIEDDYSIRTSLVEALTECGYHVVQAVDGQDGLDLVHLWDKNLCLILADLLMPRVDGWHVIAEVHKSYKHIPVHAITASHHKNPLGCTYTKKPFKLEELLAIIRSYCPKCQELGPKPITRRPTSEHEL